MSIILFTAWDYQVSLLEFVASITSFIGVGLGITGKRITWPWWAVSSALYGLLFLQWHLYSSAALQIVFIIAAAMGWFGWEASGAKPGPLETKFRITTIVLILLATITLAPLMKSIGALAAFPDTLLFFGSLAAQVLMVYEKYDNWPLWLGVDAGYTWLYATQELYFTSLLYVTFTVLAALGWRRWYATHRQSIRSL
jgi:nicotinamide mononucleotide transporter